MNAGKPSNFSFTWDAGQRPAVARFLLGSERRYLLNTILHFDGQIHSFDPADGEDGSHRSVKTAIVDIGLNNLYLQVGVGFTKTKPDTGTEGKPAREEHFGPSSMSIYSRNLYVYRPEKYLYEITPDSTLSTRYPLLAPGSLLAMISQITPKKATLRA